MPPFRTTLRAGQSAAPPTRALERFPLNRDGPVRRARRSRQREWNPKAACPGQLKATQRRTGCVVCETILADGPPDTIRTCGLHLRRVALATGGVCLSTTPAGHRCSTDSARILEIVRWGSDQQISATSGCASLSDSFRNYASRFLLCAYAEIIGRWVNRRRTHNSLYSNLFQSPSFHALS